MANGAQFKAEYYSKTDTAQAVYLVDAFGLPYAPALAAALTPWASQPTQTAAAAADTALKWNADGSATPNAVSLQNNNTINLYYSFDADSTGGTAPVYVLAPGQRIVETRHFAQLHCHSSAQVTFGGSTGFTVEAFQ